MGCHGSTRLSGDPPQDSYRPTGKVDCENCPQLQGSMDIAMIELTDAWIMRERCILVRDRAALLSYAQALIDTLCGHYKKPPV